MAETKAALAGVADADVPCGACTACCTSSQFIHVGPDETDSLAHIPAALLFPAPNLPKGYVLMGFNQVGHCPMLIDNRCSIYEHRPRTCRVYDCRVFTAADLEPDDDSKVLIAQRVRRWRFSYVDQTARAEHAEVIEAAAFESEAQITQRAVRAVAVVLGRRHT
jgi:uncharacterized protein